MPETTIYSWKMLEVLQIVPGSNSVWLWQHMATQTNKYIETLANLDSTNQSSTSLGQRKNITYVGVGLQVNFLLVFLVTELTQLFNLMFSGDSWGIWITCLSKDCTIHFLKKTVFMSGPPFLEPFFLGSFFIVLMMALQVIF